MVNREVEWDLQNQHKSASVGFLVAEFLAEFPRGGWQELLLVQDHALLQEKEIRLHKWERRKNNTRSCWICQNLELEFCLYMLWQVVVSISSPAFTSSSVFFPSSLSFLKLPFYPDLLISLLGISLFQVPVVYTSFALSVFFFFGLIICSFQFFFHSL